MRNRLLSTYLKLLLIFLADDNYDDLIAMDVKSLSRSDGLHINAQMVVNNDQLSIIRL